MTFHVLIPDNVNQAAIDLLERTKGFRVTAPGKMSREETEAAIPDADAIIVRSSTKPDADLLALAPKLKVIARAGVGVDNIDLDAATENGVVVMNTPGGNTISTAEHTLGLMLALARHIPRSHMYMSEGRWERKMFMGLELRDKTLGIIGFGRIGQAVAMRAQAFEMSVVAFDPYVDEDVMNAAGVTKITLDELYAAADFITLHSLVTDDTHEMIDADAFEKMKTGVRIVNAARGALINEGDLYAALQSGKVAGAALDVYQQEPPPADSPLLTHENVVHTPHLAASTSDAQVAVAVEAAEKIIAALQDQEYGDVVNPDVLDS